MFRRWAEARLYRKAMQIAVAALRRAARAANVLEKLEALEVAEQKLRDAQWLSADQDKSRFDAGLAEIAQSRSQTLEQAISATDRLLEVAKGKAADPREMLPAAGRLLAFLNHYLPEDRRVEVLNGRLLELGGTPGPYTPVPAIHDIYHRPDAAVGCGSLIGLLVLAVAVAITLAHL